VSCATPAERPTEALLHNIAAARQYTRLGQFIWFAAAVLDDVDALAEGPYARPAEYPWDNDE
jgi:hypothetical protein